MEKNELSFRWGILFLACMMVIGLYYCTDIPAALKPQLERYMNENGEAEMNLGILFSLYSLPNVIMPLFGGYLIDRIGVKRSLLLFCSIFTFGQILISIGISVKSWELMFVGRFLFGAGGESFVVANTAIMTDWFKGKELALAFGVNMSVSKLGSVWNDLLSPYLATHFFLTSAFWFGVLICLVCLLVVLATISIDHQMELKLISLNNYDKLAEESSHQQNGRKVGEQSFASPVQQTENTDYSNPILLAAAIEPLEIDNYIEDEKNEWTGSDFGFQQYVAAQKGGNDDQVFIPLGSTVQFSDVLRFPRSFWLLLIICFVNYGCDIPFNNIAASFLLERDYFRTPPPPCHLRNDLQCQTEINVAVSCPSSQWFQPPLPRNYSTFYPLVPSSIDCSKPLWRDGCTELFCQRFNTANYRADRMMSIPYLICALLSPPLGYFVDRFGMRALQSMISSALMVIVHYYLGFTRVNLIGPLIGQGVAYTFFSTVLWSSIPLVVEQRTVGYAFGVATCVQNFGTTVMPMVIAIVYQESGSYIPNVEIVFMILGVIGILAGLVLNCFDRYHSSVLNNSTMNFIPTNTSTKAATDK